MLDARNCEGFNEGTRNLKNFEPSGEHILKGRRNCGKKCVIESLLQATFKSFPFIIPLDTQNENPRTWEIRLSHIDKAVSSSALKNNHSCDIDKAASSSDFCDLLLTVCELMQYLSGELVYTSI